MGAGGCGGFGNGDHHENPAEIIKKVPLFQQCKDDTEFINEIVRCLKPRMCLPNSFVVRKGEVGTEMFLISRGELNVVSDDDKVMFTLKDGGFFGDIALLHDMKRVASIVARTYCDMFVLTKEDFKKVMKKFPNQSKGIKEIAKERFQNIVDAERQREQQQTGDEDARGGVVETEAEEEETGDAAELAKPGGAGLANGGGEGEPNGAPQNCAPNGAEPNGTVPQGAAGSNDANQSGSCRRVLQSSEGIRWVRC
eukprot:TRINITY_DN1090_c0_g1_i1.p1 TRINITY_DN1090_c0_g1~~TRINITY_DN1090_c0_g1_i1.p1  ORF type:complete len:253 (+),score=78.65 TRINITY_DN1090_c0_g1_i1:2721-3479(+)